LQDGFSPFPGLISPFRSVRFMPLSFQYLVDKTADLQHVILREQSTLESFSRTLRTYVPSSINIPVPRSAPSPPLVSRPVSFGSFSASQFRPVDRTPQERERQGYGNQESVLRSPAVSASSGLSRALQHREGNVDTPAPTLRGMSYPGSDPTHSDPIIWARWDGIKDGINDRSICSL
jgi:hypothetical protein